MRTQVPKLVALLLLAGLTVFAVQQQRALRATRTELASLKPEAIDLGFTQTMRLHHQQAIGMAQLLLDGRPTALRMLATSIHGQQLVELGEMQGWLRLWNVPWMPAKPGMDWMRFGDVPPDAALTRYLLDCRRAPNGMLGYASDAELQQLRRLDGRVRDALFLKLMFAHHQGGLPMARFAAGHAHLPAVRDLARRIVLDQAQELALIERMQQVLATMPDSQSSQSGPQGGEKKP